MPSRETSSRQAVRHNSARHRRQSTRLTSYGIGHARQYRDSPAIQNAPSRPTSNSNHSSGNGASTSNSARTNASRETVHFQQLRRGNSPTSDAFPRDVHAAIEAVQTTNAEDCSICLERKTDCSLLLPCLHTFCFTCIERWVTTNPQCPLCKTTGEKILHDVTPDGRFTEVHVSEMRAAAAAAQRAAQNRAPQIDADLNP